jgi:hypothetical protein
MNADIEAFVKAMEKMDSALQEAQRDMIELMRTSGEAALKAKLMKLGLVGLNVDKFCKAKSSDDRLLCIIEMHELGNC